MVLILIKLCFLRKGRLIFEEKLNKASGNGKLIYHINGKKNSKRPLNFRHKNFISTKVYFHTIIERRVGIPHKSKFIWIIIFMVIMKKLGK